MAELKALPFVPLRGLTVFPYMIIHLDIMRERSTAAIDEAMLRDKRVMLSVQLDENNEDPTKEDIYLTGTVAEIRQILHLDGYQAAAVLERIRTDLGHHVDADGL